MTLIDRHNYPLIGTAADINNSQASISSHAYS